MKRLLTFLLASPLLAPLPLHAAEPTTLKLHVDAREAPRHILHAKMKIAAQPGPLTLEYPRWIPGEHGPTGPIKGVSGLVFSAGGHKLAWQRDPVEMDEFHIDVPPGAEEVEASLDLLLPTSTEGFSFAASSSAKLLLLSWNQVLIYPKGARADEITATASVQLPPDWKYATPLREAGEAEGAITFQPVTLRELVDSPLLSGMNFFQLRLFPGEPLVHELDVAADSVAAIQIPPALVVRFQNLVREARVLFGTRHYRHYQFLVSLSDHVAHFGLEHHESSDDRLPERAFVDDLPRKLSAGLLPHEFVHSWNGKFRRPAGLATSDYSEPMKGELLWVYEGLTQYLGALLTARSGLWTPEEYRERLAFIAATLDYRAGRTWRPLSDTAVAAQILYETEPGWDSRRRSVDFYDEGWLLWLEADMLIRQRSKGKRSLDDFCKGFLGGPGEEPAVKTYTLDDVVAALNQVEPYDWKAFFDARLSSTEPSAPLGGLKTAGWKLVYNATPNEMGQEDAETSWELDQSFSLGLKLKPDGTIVDVVPGRPADLAAMAPGTKVVAVNGRRFTPGVLRDAVRMSPTLGKPLELLAENGDYFFMHPLDYKDGERYPHLQRDKTKPDLLEPLLKPMAK